MSNNLERIDASLALGADDGITRNESHGIAFAYESKQLWCGKATLAEIADALPEVET